MIGEEFMLAGRLVRVIDETLITSFSVPVSDPAAKPLSYTRQVVEPVPLETDQAPET